MILFYFQMNSYLTRLRMYICLNEQYYIKNVLNYELFLSVSCTHVCLYLQYIPYLGKVSVHCCLNFKRSSIGNSPQSFCSSTTPYCSPLTHINYAQLRILLLFHKHHLLFFFSNGINGRH